jgi:hypothetical protein
MHVEVELRDRAGRQIVRDAGDPGFVNLDAFRSAFRRLVALPEVDLPDRDAPWVRGLELRLVWSYLVDGRQSFAARYELRHRETGRLLGEEQWIMPRDGEDGLTPVALDRFAEALLKRVAGDLDRGFRGGGPQPLRTSTIEIWSVALEGRREMPIAAVRDCLQAWPEVRDGGQVRIERDSRESWGREFKFSVRHRGELFDLRTHLVDCLGEGDLEFDAFVTDQRENQLTIVLTSLSSCDTAGALAGHGGCSGEEVEKARGALRSAYEADNRPRLLVIVGTAVPRDGPAAVGGASATEASNPDAPRPSPPSDAEPRVNEAPPASGGTSVTVNINTPGSGSGPGSQAGEAAQRAEQGRRDREEEAQRRKEAQEEAQKARVRQADQQLRWEILENEILRLLVELGVDAVDGATLRANHANEAAIQRMLDDPHALRQLQQMENVQVVIRGTTDAEGQRFTFRLIQTGDATILGAARCEQRFNRDDPGECAQAVVGQLMAAYLGRKGPPQAIDVQLSNCATARQAMAVRGALEGLRNDRAEVVTVNFEQLIPDLSGGLATFRLRYTGNFDDLLSLLLDTIEEKGDLPFDADPQGGNRSLIRLRVKQR